MMTVDGPYLGEGWDTPEEILAGVDERNPEQYGFESQQELLSHVKAMVPGQDDMDRQRDELNKSYAKCPHCLDDIEEYLSKGAMRGDIDINPNVYQNYWTESESTKMYTADQKVKHGMYMGCQNHPEEVWMNYFENEYIEE